MTGPHRRRWDGGGRRTASGWRRWRAGDGTRSPSTSRAGSGRSAITGTASWGGGRTGAAQVENRVRSTAHSGRRDRVASRYTVGGPTRSLSSATGLPGASRSTAGAGPTGGSWASSARTGRSLLPQGWRRVLPDQTAAWRRSARPAAGPSRPTSPTRTASCTRPAGTSTATWASGGRRRRTARPGEERRGRRRSLRRRRRLKTGGF
mmetsp:Transcript_23951/g.56710  ORF Transcript_23951/g.56710 Transcript_23951/m.56710 type:complete len:206 (-) Transcript_23951:39-656(-)